MEEDPDESVPVASPYQAWNCARAPTPRDTVPMSRRAVVCVPVSYQPAFNTVPYGLSIRRLYWSFQLAIATFGPFMRMGAEVVPDPDASPLQPLKARRDPKETGTVPGAVAWVVLPDAYHPPPVTVP